MQSQIKLKNLSPGQVADLLPKNLILLGYRGSIAHNMYAEEAYVRSSLPPKPDQEKAEELCIAIVADYHRLNEAASNNAA